MGDEALGLRAAASFMSMKDILDSKLARRAELVTELQRIDADLAVGLQFLQARANELPKKGEPGYVPPSKQYRNRKESKMSLDTCRQLLRTKGPQTTEEIRVHFYGVEGSPRATNILRTWLYRKVLRFDNGKWALPVSES